MSRHRLLSCAYAPPHVQLDAFENQRIREEPVDYQRSLRRFDDFHQLAIRMRGTSPAREPCDVAHDIRQACILNGRRIPESYR
ncbi:MAG: hypothetical protein WD042_10340 [Phycisphaeraceae bacterium]